MSGTTTTVDRITLQVASASTPDTWYTLTIFDDGLAVCSCPGYHYRCDCRHTREERARLTRWNSRTCTACGASGPSAAFTATTVYHGGHGYETTHTCRNTASCTARQGAAVA